MTEGQQRIRLACQIDRRARFPRQRIPQVEIDHHVARREGLVPAGKVVIRRHTAEAQHAIDDGQGVLGGVDRALLQRLEDLAARDHRDRRSEPLQDPAAQSGETDLAAFEVLE